MRVLLDECLPKRLVRDLSAAHKVSTVPRQGWAGSSDSELLRLIPGEFDVWITMDSNLPYQQTLHDKPFGVVILLARSNRYETIRELVPELLEVLASLRPGSVVTIPDSSVSI